jgi:predicted phage baseplate assembly protein
LRAYDPARLVFNLDADSGVVTFGNAQAGAIPPLGADIVVRSYRRVIGEAANAVFQDAELQLVSPIAGVESVKALEPAAGGADAEPPDQARARGPAKLRHGGRLQTLADLEEAVMASGRDVAQVKAATWRGGVRLIVALGSDSPVPGPARLRAVHAALAEAAGYGITRPNGLTVVGPRPLTLLLRIAVRLDSLDNIVAVQEGADAALRALFDPRSGGADGKGWPFGRRPVTEDCMGALDSVGGRAVIDGIEILDAGSGAPLPDAIAADRLVRVAEVRVDPTLVQGAAG